MLWGGNYLDLQGWRDPDKTRQVILGTRACWGDQWLSHSGGFQVSVSAPYQLLKWWICRLTLCVVRQKAKVGTVSPQIPERKLGH